MRIERFEVLEDDAKPQDFNDSDGAALTINYRYSLSRQWHVGAEVHSNQSYVENRQALNVAQDQGQSQIMGVLEYRF